MAKTVKDTTPTATALALLESGPGAQAGFTEQDIIRQLIDSSEVLSSRLKGKLRTSTGQADTLDALETASRAGQAQAETSLKLCQRIWTAYTKYIRAQAAKDRLVDSLFYGYFWKNDGDVAAGNQYCFATDGRRHNAFADFKVV